MSRRAPLFMSSQEDKHKRPIDVVSGLTPKSKKLKISKNIQEDEKENLELSFSTFFGLTVIPRVMILD